MQEQIEKFELAKAQIGGEIMAKYGNGVPIFASELDKMNELRLLEARAELYNALIDLAKAFDKLTTK